MKHPRRSSGTSRLPSDAASSPTPTLSWALSEPGSCPIARSAITNPTSLVYVSAASYWEIAIKVSSASWRPTSARSSERPRTPLRNLDILHVMMSELPSIIAIPLIGCWWGRRAKKGSPRVEGREASGPIRSRSTGRSALCSSR